MIPDRALFFPLQPLDEKSARSYLAAMTDTNEFTPEGAGIIIGNVIAKIALTAGHRPAVDFIEDLRPIVSGVVESLDELSDEITTAELLARLSMMMITAGETALEAMREAVEQSGVRDEPEQDEAGDQLMPQSEATNSVAAAESDDDAPTGGDPIEPERPEYEPQVQEDESPQDDDTAPTDNGEDGEDTKPIEAPKKARKKAPPKPGKKKQDNAALADSILKCLRSHSDGLAMGDIVSYTGAPVTRVRRAIQALIASGEIVAEGATRARRYKIGQ